MNKVNYKCKIWKNISENDYPEKKFRNSLSWLWILCM